MQANLSKGQGFVEYALIIGIVAIVVLAVIGLIHLAIARGYGLIACEISAKLNVHVAQGAVIEIQQANCYVSSPFPDSHQGKTTLEISGFLGQGITFQDMSISTDQGFLLQVDQFGSNGPNS